MHAVVMRSAIHDFEQSRKNIAERGVPGVRHAPGFIKGYWFRLDEMTGGATRLFESEEAAVAAVERLKQNLPAGSAATLERIEIGEVVAEA